VSRPSRNADRESRVRYVELSVRTGRTVALHWICPLRAIVSRASFALCREGAFSGPVSQHIPSAMQVRTTSNQRQGPSQPICLSSPLSVDGGGGGTFTCSSVLWVGRCLCIFAAFSSHERIRQITIRRGFPFNFFSFSCLPSGQYCFAFPLLFCVIEPLGSSLVPVE
jgi:hypothetical protein